MITVVFIKNPFEPQQHREIFQCEYKPGKTIHEYVEQCSHGLTLPDMTISRNSYTINGNLPAHDGDFLVFAPVIGKGGGKNPLLIIATVALSVVSMGVGGIVAGAGWTGLAGATGWAAIGGYLAAAAVMFVGGTLIQRAFGTAATNLDYGSENPTYSWSGISTTTGQNNPIPITYGLVRSGGQTIGKYITNDGDKQYLNWLIAAGYGPLTISDIQLNDNPIENFENVEVEIRQGTYDQDIVKNFNDTISTKSLGYEILEDKWRTDIVTGSATQGIIIYVECSNGLYYANDKGGLDTTYVEIAAEYAPLNSNEWKSFLTPQTYIEDNDYGIYMREPVAAGEYKVNAALHPADKSHTVRIGEYSTTITANDIANKNIVPCGPFDIHTAQMGVLLFIAWAGIIHVRNTREENGSGRIEGNKSSAIRRQYRIDNLPAGQYQVRVKVTGRGYPTTSTRAATRIWWTAVSGIVYDDFTYPGIALIGIKALATDQLSGAPSIKFMKERKTVFIWNPDTKEYEEKDATNPAWAAYDMIHRAEKITDIRDGSTTFIHAGANAELMMYNQFSEWADYCERFKLKLNIEINTLGEMMDIVNKYISAVGRGIVELFGTKYGCCWDGPKEAVQMFGMGNIISGTFSETFLQTSDRANAVELTFTNAQKDYERDTIKVYGDSFDTDEYDTTSQLTYDGITDYEQAYREAKFQLYCNQYMVRTVSFQAAIDAIACTVGDVIFVSHDIPMWQTSGRITAVDGNEVTVNAVMENYDASKNYVFAYRAAKTDTRYEVACSNITINNDSTTITLNEVPAVAPLPDDIFDIAEVKKGAKKFVVRSISRAEDLTREIEALEYNENVFNEQYDIPPMERPTAPDNSAKNVINLQGKQINYLDDSNARHQRIFLTWQYPEGKPYSRFDIFLSKDGKNYVLFGSTGELHYEGETEVGTDYRVKVVTVAGLSTSTGTSITVGVGNNGIPAIELTNLQAYTRYRLLPDGTPRYDIVIKWEPKELEGRVYYKTNHVRGEDMVFTTGIPANQIGYQGPWTMGGTGVGECVIPQAVAGDTYRVAVTTADATGTYILPDIAPMLEVHVAAKTEIPNTPDGFKIEFSDVVTVSWNEVTNTDISIYELRTDENVGNEEKGLLARTTGRSTTPTLSNRMGKLYLFAQSTGGKYSTAAILDYHKEKPPTPLAPKLVAKLGGVSIEGNPIPYGCNGMNIYISASGEDKMIDTVNNVYSYMCGAGIYDVRVAYKDIFGEGEKSPTSTIAVKALIDDSFIEDEAISLKKVDKVVQDAIKAGQDASAAIPELRKDLNETIDTSIKELKEADIGLKQTTTELSNTMATQKKTQDNVNEEFRSQFKQTSDGISTIVANLGDPNKASTAYKAFSSIKQTIDSITATVSANKTAQDGTNATLSSQIKQTSDGISTIVANLGDPNKANTAYKAFASIKQTTDSITSTVSANKTAQDKTNATFASTIKQNADSITTVVSNLQSADKATQNYGAFSIMNDNINLRVKKDDVINQINVSPESILIEGKKIHITGDTIFDDNVIVNKMLQANSITADKLAAQDIVIGDDTATGIVGGAVRLDKDGLTVTQKNGTSTHFNQNGMIFTDSQGNAFAGIGRFCTGQANDGDTITFNTPWDIIPSILLFPIQLQTSASQYTNSDIYQQVMPSDITKNGFRVVCRSILKSGSSGDAFPNIQFAVWSGKKDGSWKTYTFDISIPSSATHIQIDSNILVQGFNSEGNYGVSSYSKIRYLVDDKIYQDWEDAVRYKGSRYAGKKEAGIGTKSSNFRKNLTVSNNAKISIQVMFSGEYEGDGKGEIDYPDRAYGWATINSYHIDAEGDVIISRGSCGFIAVDPNTVPFNITKSQQFTGF